MEKMQEGLHGLSTFPESQSGYWGTNILIGEDSSKTREYWAKGRLRCEDLFQFSTYEVPGASFLLILRTNLRGRYYFPRGSKRSINLPKVTQGVIVQKSNLSIS